MLEVTGLAVSYGSVRALRGVSLNVASNEVVAVIGSNGAGKSTLMLTIAGALKPVTGAINFQGKSLLARPPESIVKSGISLVREGRHILGSLTVEENLLLGATTRNDRNQIARDLHEMYELFPPLRVRYRSSAASLSGGEQQQLAIARALLSRPKLLLLDEPSLGLAPLVVDLIFDTLNQLRREGLTILLVEQNVPRASELADRIYVLRTGEVHFHGTVEELQATAESESLYLGAG